MNWIEIRGPTDVLRGLLDIVGLDIVIHSGIQVNDLESQVTAFGTDEAIAAVTARGASVEVILTGEDLDQRVKDAFSPNIG